MLNNIDTYNKMPRRTALTSTGTQAKYNNSEGLARRNAEPSAFQLQVTMLKSDKI